MRIPLTLVGACAIAIVGCYAGAHVGRSLTPCATNYPREHRRAIAVRAGMHLLWSQDCLYASPNFGDSRLVSSSGALALLGTDSVVPLSRVTVRDPKDGAALWHTSWASSSEIAADEQALYIGGIWGAVERRSPLSGDVMWRRVVTPSRRVFSLHVYGPWVYAYANPDSFHLLRREDGQPIDPVEIRSLHTVSIILRDMAIGDSIRAEDLSTHDITWVEEVDLGVIETPIISGDVVVVRAGEQVGWLVGLGLATGELLWRSEAEVVSNLAIFEDGILFLDGKGELHLVDPATGSDSILLKYDGGELMLASDLTGTVGGYYLAADAATGTIHVLLGDTGQLDTFVIDLGP